MMRFDHVRAFGGLALCLLATACSRTSGVTLGDGVASAGPKGDDPHGTPGAQGPGAQYYDDSLALIGAAIHHEQAIDALVVEIEVEGQPGTRLPEPVGDLDGAPVLGYVVATTLKPQDVGFPPGPGTVALAILSHPDADDTPLWDENGNGNFSDDGGLYHSHWMVLEDSDEATAGLAVRLAQDDEATRLPPTAAPPTFVDAPGFPVVTDGHMLRVVVPLARVHGRTDFGFDAASVYMELDASTDPASVKVENIYETLSADFDLPYKVETRGQPPGHPPTGTDPFSVSSADAVYVESLQLWVVTVETSGLAGAQVPPARGRFDGAEISSYALPVSLSPEVVGFGESPGVLVLALSAHPDFDDTPLWDENGDGDYNNDAATYHAHWQVVTPDDQSPAGYSVGQPGSNQGGQRPPTAPPLGLPLDSPGFHVFAHQTVIRALIPAPAIGRETSFSYDVVGAQFRVDDAGAEPVFRLTEVVDIFSGNLTLVYESRTSPDLGGL